MIELANIWFYTLSTSAQVLAALAGLFAVFVVYKLQGINSYLEDVRMVIAESLLPYYSSNIRGDFVSYRAVDLISQSNKELILKFSQMLNMYKKDPDKFRAHPAESGFKSNFSSISYYDLNDNTLNYYKNKIKQKEDIIKKLRENLIFGFILISFCIIELSLTDYFINLMVLFFTSVSIVLYLISIAKNVYLISID